MTKVKTIFTLIFFICIILRCVIHFFSSTFTPTILNNVITQQIDLFKLYYQYFRLHFISCVIIIGKLSNYFFIYSNHSILLFSDCQAKETQRRNKWCITFVKEIQHWSIPSKYCKLKNVLFCNLQFRWKCPWCSLHVHAFKIGNTLWTVLNCFLLLRQHFV